MSPNEVKAAVLVASLYDGPPPAPAWVVRLVAAILDDVDAQHAHTRKLLEKYLAEYELDRADIRDLDAALRALG